MSCHLGTEKMPIILDQPEADSDSPGHGLFHAIELSAHQHRGTATTNASDRNYIGDVSNGKTFKIVSKEQVKANECAVAKKMTEESLKKYSPVLVAPHFVYNSSELLGFSTADESKATDAVPQAKIENKKLRRRLRPKVDFGGVAEVVADGEAFKVKETRAKRKSKQKEKGTPGRKCFKLIAPHPGGREELTGKPVEAGYPCDVAKGVRVGKDLHGRSGETYIADSHLLTDFDGFGKDGKTEDKHKGEFETKVKCFTCYDCSFVTASADAFNCHVRKKDKCLPASKVYHCPGCKNTFHSLTPLRVHLVHDHRTPQKEAKLLVQNVREVDGKDKPSCAFESSASQIIANGNLFDEAGHETEMTGMVATTTGDEITKGNYVQCPNERNFAPGEELEPCLNKRQTMLESYLDDISNKGDCNLPPALTQNGSDLLENTFNFTAPVSEQLPSIQPPPAHSSSNGLLDHSHLIMSQTGNHGYVGMANVFPGHRDEEQYKGSEGGDDHGYDGNSNLMLANGTYMPHHHHHHHHHQIHDIPVINLDESHIAKQTENMLSQDINMDDFTAYPTENGLPALDEEEQEEGEEAAEATATTAAATTATAATPCRLPVEDDDHEKKKLKKLGVGYRCDINGCKVRLQSEKNIQYHRRCHEGTLYNCPECCKDCSTWVSLSSHLWQAHKIDMELYKCDQCPYKTPSYSRLTNIHRGIHGKARPFLCDVCGKGFKTVKQMRNHKNIHKAKMVRMSVCHCDICGRTVADKRQLELHINNTHRKKKPYLCYMCGYASAVKHSLVVHMRRHTGEKPYECEKCEYKTADHNALRRHKMKHSGVRNYKCNHCSYTCIQASTYKVHIKTKHPGLETDVIFGCGRCNFQTLNRGSFLSHTSEHENYNVEVRKEGGPRCQAGKAAPETPRDDYYEETNRLDLVAPMMSDGVVETIVDLSGAQTLLEDDDDYYERITGDLENAAREIKFKSSGIT